VISRSSGTSTTSYLRLDNELPAVSSAAGFDNLFTPLLENSSIAWNQDFVCLIDLIENVQRHFVKRITSVASFSCLDRLVILDLDLLELRRLRFDLIYYMKVFNHLTPFNPTEVFTIYTPAARS
jgi:hypothetical protein